MTLSEFMKARMDELGKDGYECAEAAGMSPSEWSRWASGQSRRKNGLPSAPRPETSAAIARGLEVPVTTITDILTQQPKRIPKSVYEEQAAQIVARIGEIADEIGQREAVNMLRAYMNGVVAMHQHQVAA